MIEIFTIGVYNSTEESYFGKLMDAKIDLFCDIRQRRGVRGSLYKYVNTQLSQVNFPRSNSAYSCTNIACRCEFPQMASRISSL